VKNKNQSLKIHRQLCLLLTLILIIALSACSTKNPAGESLEESAAQNVENRIEPLADQSLKDMSEFLATHKSMRFNVSIVEDELLATGERIQTARSSKVTLRRPDRFQVSIKGDLRSGDFYYNGKTVTIHDRDAKTYAVTEAPASIDNTLDKLADEYRIIIPVADLIFSDSYQVLSENIESGRYVGLHSINGVPCHHLSFRQFNIDWQIWVEQGKKPWPRKFVITYKGEEGSPQFSATLSNWNTAANSRDSKFEFAAPTGVTEIEFEGPDNSKLG